MKRECPSLFAALLVSLLVNVLLRSQTAYRPRAGLAAAPLCALLLAAVGWLFARCWRLACDPVLRLLFGALLVFSSVLELLRLWQLADRLYPGAVTLSSVCLLAVLPVVYLRRVSALSQTARAVLCLLAAATAVMLISVLPRLRITNLQYSVFTRTDFFTAAKDQLTLYPEYLLPALWPAQDKRGRHTLLRLAGYALAFDVSIHLLLELFYGVGRGGAVEILDTEDRDLEQQIDGHECAHGQYGQYTQNPQCAAAVALADQLCLRYAPLLAGAAGAVAGLLRIDLLGHLRASGAWLAGLAVGWLSAGCLPLFQSHTAAEAAAVVLRAGVAHGSLPAAALVVPHMSGSFRLGFGIQSRAL